MSGPVQRGPLVFALAALATAAAPAGLAGCRAEPSTAAPAADAARVADVGAPPPAPSASASDPVPPPLPPLPGFFEPLVVPGHPDAWLSLPTNATSRRPVVIVVHGAADKPEWECGGWRHATGEFPFVLCPRGALVPEQSTKDDARYTLRGGAPLLVYIDASLAALESRYPRYVDATTPLLAGFSLGASEALALAVQDPARFPRLALVEGATNGWTDARIDAYRAGGGQRVLYATGQSVNRDAARAAVKHLLARGLDAREVFAPVHHTFYPALEDAVHGELAWFVAGDTRWSP